MASPVNIYDELKLRIAPADSGGYRVLATSTIGEASASFSMPFSDLEVENFVLRVSRAHGRRRVDSPATEDAKHLGGQLFAAVFQGGVRDLYREALARAQGQGRGLRVTMCLSDAPGLMDVPWEYLYEAPDFLVTSAFTPIVRYLDLPRGYRPLKVELPLRILGMISSPCDQEPLQVDKERADLEAALGGLVAQGAVAIDWLERPTLGALLRKLQSASFHVLHFVGHGSYSRQAEQGLLLLEDDKGQGQPMSGDKLAAVLRDFTSLRLVVLNACEGARTSRVDPFAGVATSLVQREIPAVIAMQFEITDASAVVFAEAFYRALASGAPVDTALAAARLAMFAERSDDIEWGTPVLFMRVGDGRIFELPERAAESNGAPTPAVKDGRATGGPAGPPTEQPERAPLGSAARVGGTVQPGRTLGRIPRRRWVLAGVGAILLAAIGVSLALALGGRSVGDLNTPEGRQIVSTTEKFGNAVLKDEASTACELLTPSAQQKVASFYASSSCPEAVTNAIAHIAAGGRLAKIVDVRINGATAVATSESNGKEGTTELVKNDGHWLINSIPEP
jgi:hypothetical protein